VTTGVDTGVYRKIPKRKEKKTPELRDIEEEDDGTQRNILERMRNHSIPSRTQQALSRCSKVGVDNEVEYLPSV
jgi:uncharacterized membrane protein